MDLARSRLQCWQIAKANLRHNFLPHLAVSAVLLLLTPILFGTANLDRQAAAVPLEVFVSLAGLILLTPVFQPELDLRIEEVMASKYVGSVWVYVIRIIYSLAALSLLIALFAVYMRLNGCEMTLPVVWGTISTAMFLGSLGMLTAAVSKNTAVSYMVPVGYYAMNLGGGSKLDPFYLFTMMNGEYGIKIWLFVSSMILISLAVFVSWVMQRNK